MRELGVQLLGTVDSSLFWGIIQRVTSIGEEWGPELLPRTAAQDKAGMPLWGKQKEVEGVRARGGRSTSRPVCPKAAEAQVRLPAREATSAKEGSRYSVLAVGSPYC